mmetsp:Transcript_101285/g.292909  ORF Transcript_101285/g.292909 Transcript_101285/m.292909 type:complete len:245 (+) Transcript_101285:112-846(+)
MSPSVSQTSASSWAAYVGLESKTSKASAYGSAESVEQRAEKPSGERTKKPRHTEGFSRAQRNGNGLVGCNPAMSAVARTTSNVGSAGNVRWGSRKTRESSWVPTKKCAEDPLFPLANPWNSGSVKQASTPGRYCATLNSFKPSLLHTSTITARAPATNLAATSSRKIGPSSNTAQATPCNELGKEISSPPCAMSSNKWPTALAAEVGPNHTDGSLPSSFWPASTKRCREKGASGASKKHDTMSR